MKTEELRDFSPAELEARVKELKGELFNLQFQHASGQLENNQRIKVAKRDIARALTIHREKTLSASLRVE